MENKKRDISGDCKCDGRAMVNAAHVCPKRTLPGGWREVVFAADCEDLGDGERGACPCGLDYCDGCVCPGPTQDGIEYITRRGVLYGRDSGA